MALYERDYIKNKTLKEKTTYNSVSNLSEFIKQTYQLFAGSLLVGATGSYIGMGIPVISNYYWLFVILEFALIFGIGFSKSKPGLNLFMLFAFSFVSGLTLSVILSHFINAGAGAIVANSLILTMIAFGSLSLFAMNTSRDFTSLGNILFISVIIIIAASLLNVFIFHNSIMQLIISIIGSILFSVFILYDTQNIIKGNYGSPVDGALALYIDFVNLFSSLLQILGFLNSEE